MNLVFLGPPGAGKGTQAVRVCEVYGLAHIATGDILRASVAAGSDLGRRVGHVMAAGDLVSDDLIGEVIAARLGESDCARGAVFDGFPRTLRQVEILEGLLVDRGGVDRVIFFDIEPAELVSRIEARAREAGSQAGRADDTPGILDRRLEEYRVKTRPLIDFYHRAGLLEAIDGSAPIEEVAGEIGDLLTDLLQKKTASVGG